MTEETSRPYVVFPPPSPTPWPAAIQNVAAIGALVWLAHERLITGQWAAGIILAVLGVVTFPQLVKRATTPNIGIVTLMCGPLIRMVMDIKGVWNA